MKTSLALLIVLISSHIVFARTGRKVEDADSGGRDRFSRDVSLSQYESSDADSDGNSGLFENLVIRTPGVAIFKRLDQNQLNRPRLIMTFPKLLIIGRSSPSITRFNIADSS